MKLKLFLLFWALATINQSFSITEEEQRDLNYKLPFAAMAGNKAEVDSLLKAGADITTQEKGGTTIYWAAYFGHPATVDLLLSKGADVNAKDDLFGNTPLHGAAQRDEMASAELLLSYGADVNAKNKAGLPPLAFTKKMVMQEFLRNYPALLKQVEQTPKGNLTHAQLKDALEHGYYGLVALLLKRGVIPNANDLKLVKDKAKTAIDKQPYEMIGRLLIEKLSLLPVKEGVPVGSVSKAGIVGVYGLPKEIAQKIGEYIP